MEKVDWSALYPEGYTYLATRHMPRSMHRRLGVLAKVMGISGELLLVQCLEVGLGQFEAKAYGMGGEVPGERGTVGQ